MTAIHTRTSGTPASAPYRVQLALFSRTVACARARADEMWAYKQVRACVHVGLGCGWLRGSTATLPGRRLASCGVRNGVRAAVAAWRKVAHADSCVIIVRACVQGELERQNKKVLDEKSGRRLARCRARR
jgi:hypothetical protein